jgi:hypothetical protein
VEYLVAANSTTANLARASGAVGRLAAPGKETIGDAVSDFLHSDPVQKITEPLIAESGVGPLIGMVSREGAITRFLTKLFGSEEKLISAEERANQFHSALDPRAQRARTTAVTETEEGIRVVSSSERRLAPAQRALLKTNEVEGVGVGHAETTSIEAAKRMGLTPTGTAASRPICSGCAQVLEQQKIDPLSPVK